jgi:hypothetical protein
MEKGVKEGCADVGVGDSMKTISHPSPHNLSGFINWKPVYKVILTLAEANLNCFLIQSATEATKTDWTLCEIIFSPP